MERLTVESLNAQNTCLFNCLTPLLQKYLFLPIPNTYIPLWGKNTWPIKPLDNHNLQNPFRFSGMCKHKPGLKESSPTQQLWFRQENRLGKCHSTRGAWGVTKVPIIQK